MWKCHFLCGCISMNWCTIPTCTNHPACLVCPSSCAVMWQGWLRSFMENPDEKEWKAISVQCEITVTIRERKNTVTWIKKSMIKFFSSSDIFGHSTFFSPGKINNACMGRPTSIIIFSPLAFVNQWNYVTTGSTFSLLVQKL